MRSKLQYWNFRSVTHMRTRRKMKGNIVILIPLVQIKDNLHYLAVEGRRNGAVLVTTSALFSNRMAFENVLGRYGDGEGVGWERGATPTARSRVVHWWWFVHEKCNSKIPSSYVYIYWADLNAADRRQRNPRSRCTQPSCLIYLVFDQHSNTSLNFPNKI
jgi:hypothetical protein